MKTDNLDKTISYYEDYGWDVQGTRSDGLAVFTQERAAASRVMVTDANGVIYSEATFDNSTIGEMMFDAAVKAAVHR